MYICKEEDREKILKYISKEPEMNLFIRGNLENFGVSTEFLNFTALGSPSNWTGLIMNFHNNFVIYSENNDYDLEEFRLALLGKKILSINGKAQCVERVKDLYPNMKFEHEFMCKCNKVINVNHNFEVRELNIEDINSIQMLLLKIKEFGKPHEGEEFEIWKKTIEHNMEAGSKDLGIFVHGHLVSIASSAADNSESSMIVGVATDENFRNQGFASAVVSELVNKLLSNGKKYVCLFYSNPKAGNIYYRIGFKEIGKYALMT